MPRRPRIHLDGVPLHIVQRGHNREACFFGEEDYQAYLHWLGEALKKERCALHAYALMTNHVHLLVTPERAERIKGARNNRGQTTVLAPSDRRNRGLSPITCGGGLRQ